MADNNTGNYNTGHGNSGNRNTGHWNSGHYNSGHGNSGQRNSGNDSSGYCNSGSGNSGNENSGWQNSGNWNSGWCNSGHGNSGWQNSGNWNSGYGNSGHFNTVTPNVMMFNKDTGLQPYEISVPCIVLPITEWVIEKNMTEKEKTDNPDYKTAGGYLKSRPYKEAWAIAWEKASDETKQQFLELPNFDPEIFEEITGINVKRDEKEEKENKEADDNIVTINGKQYKLVEINKNGE